MLANPFITVIGCALAIFVVYRIVQEHSDPIREKIWTARYDADEHGRAAIFEEWSRLREQNLDKAIPTCIEAMKADPSPMVRLKATEFVITVPPDHPLAPSVSQILIESLKDREAYVRSTAAQGLALLKPPIPMALPSLLAVLSSRHETSRQENRASAQGALTHLPYLARPWAFAADAITAIVMANPSELSILEKLVREADFEVQSAVLDALPKYAQGRPEEWDLLTFLRKSPSANVRARATSAAFNLVFPGSFQRRQPAFQQFEETAITWAVEDLHEDAITIISQTAGLIARFRPPAKQVMPALLEATYRLNTSVDSPHLQNQVSPADQARHDLIQAMGELGPLGPAAVETLLRLAENPLWTRSYGFTPLLIKAGKQDRRVLTALCRLANDQLATTRNEAIKGLAQFPNDAAVCFPALRQAYLSAAGHENDMRLVRDSLKQLIRPGPLPQGFPSVEELWKGDDTERLVAVMSSTPNAPQGMAALRRALSSPNHRIRAEALMMLDLCDTGHTEDGIKALEPIANDDASHDLRFWARSVMENLRKRSKTSLPTERLQNQDTKSSQQK